MRDSYSFCDKMDEDSYHPETNADKQTTKQLNRMPQESTPKETINNNDSNKTAEAETQLATPKIKTGTAKMECSICLDNCVHPVQLPCKHIFCFLCVKGASSLCHRCPICRKCIPTAYFENPMLIEKLTDSDIIQYNGAQWFYEGRNGWWLYDERTSEELDEAYKTGRPQCHLLIAGHLYIIDFVRMVQCRKNEPHRQRRIKRDDVKSTPTKGIAGIKINPPALCQARLTNIRSERGFASAVPSTPAGSSNTVTSSASKFKCRYLYSRMRF